MVSSLDCGLGVEEWSWVGVQVLERNDPVVAGKSGLRVDVEDEAEVEGAVE